MPPDPPPSPPYNPSDLALEAPKLLQLRHEAVDAHTGYALHRHPWGQINRINLGLIEITLGLPPNEQHLIAPADFLVWVPAQMPHTAYIRQALSYTSAYLGDEWAQHLPKTACLIRQTPLIRALFDDYAARQVSSTTAANEQAQATLLLERLISADQHTSYLPETTHRQLRPILDALLAQPGDTTTLAQWAQHVHSTERTLARQFQRELGLSFIQWRNRLRLLRAQAALKEHHAIQDIAWQLGYSHPSAFIAMFRQHTGLSPERYRRQWRNHQND
ncbi:AraC family transcriptional regulator [Deefgea piscis]|uniref:AraC family transcriptional regulator n=1 Tax=Deefgea piscis TaxID=2739061 RepID=UPI001C7FB82A|nr:helix-turn-helix transcriptional regulator [Deefgea piscis]QZA80790.1 helix-turn-helix transcriptional regulator [Deefgea piscis]